MKEKKRFIFTLSVLFALASCGKNNNNSNNSQDTTSNNSNQVIQEDPIGTITPDTSINDLKMNTLHQINVTKNVKDFIVDSKTDYQIVLPEVIDDEKITSAATELKYFLGESTGVDIKIINDNNLSFDESKKYISVGDTKLVNQANIKVDKELLTRSGYQITSKGNSVFLIGGGDYGTLFSAYEFLSHEIGFEAYSDVSIEYVKEKTIKLHEYDIIDVPDIQYCLAPTGWAFYNTKARQRLRFNHENEVWMGPQNISWHNTMAYLPYAQYGASHPKWYSDDKRDLCFHAHGDEEEYKEFFDAFMKSFISVIEKDTSIENITITQQDYNTWCSCNECLADKEKYGTNGATIVKFCNQVSDALKVYFEENNIKRKINICFFAYQQTTNAPVIKDEKGNFVPIDDDVICRDNVYVFYAPIRAEFLYDFGNPANSAFLDIMDKWCSISPHIYLWIYSVNFYDLLTPYNTMASMQNTYKILKAHNALYLYDQALWNRNNHTDWNSLRVYLNSKLRWNVNANVEELTMKFMRFNYGIAADKMKEALDLYNAWFDHLKYEVNVGGSYIDSTLFTATNFPKGFLQGMLNKFDEAMEIIAPLEETDGATFNTIKRRIVLETIPYQYLNIEFNQRDYTDDELYNLKMKFKYDATYSGIMHYTESASIESLYEKWGIM